MNKSLIPKIYVILIIAISLTGCADALKEMLALASNGMLIISLIIFALSSISKSEVGLSMSITVIGFIYAVAYFSDSLDISFPFIKAVITSIN
ncbi:hypothetical protein [Acinetobacter pittii]|uniref:Lipoprotein n=1 Tax=Acinetobacter pittii TaxID=48296 RepID=A0A6H0G0C5_ACIPI|nr:hypothetical protein [Acinetobacter pittii]QIT20002.1 hypothetical protein G8E09_19525 [Acinetobacter pittii]